LPPVLGGSRRRPRARMFLRRRRKGQRVRRAGFDCPQNGVGTGVTETSSPRRNDPPVLERRTVIGAAGPVSNGLGGAARPIRPPRPSGRNAAASLGSARGLS